MRACCGASLAAALSLAASPARASDAAEAGLVVARLGSPLEDAAARLAGEKGWAFEPLESGDPKAIRRTIRASHARRPFRYLLIVGDESEIPLRDPGGLLPGERERLVLDSYYYGTLGPLEASFVSLAVGRLPFSRPDEVWRYVASLTDEGRPFVETYPLSPGSESDSHTVHQYADALCLQKAFPSLEAARNSPKRDLLSRLAEASVMEIHSHGSPLGFKLGPGEGFGLGDLRGERWRNAPMIVGLACNPAERFGKEALRHGAGAFIGFYNIGGALSRVLLEGLLEGRPAGEAVRDALNRDFLAGGSLPTTRPGGRGGAYVTPGLHDVDLAIRYRPWMRSTQRDPFGLVLYGDPSFSKAPLAREHANVRASRSGGRLAIEAGPAAEAPLDEERSLLCYNGGLQLANLLDRGGHELKLVVEARGLGRLGSLRALRNGAELDAAATRALLERGTFALVRDHGGSGYLVVAVQDWRKGDRVRLEFSDSEAAWPDKPGR